MKIGNIIWDLEKFEDESELFAAKEAQKIVEEKWFYKKQCPNFLEEFYNKIRYYDSSKMYSQAIHYANNSNVGYALNNFTKFGDFVLIADFQYMPVQSISKSRSNGFSFNFYNYLLIAYYPEFNFVRYAFVTRYK